MSKRASKRAARVLRTRQRAHPKSGDGAFTEPGSLNPKKSFGRSQDRRRG